MFRAIASDDFPPFGKFLLKLPPVENKPSDLAEVHLFTGINGTGKTRLLSLFSALLGQPTQLIQRLKGKSDHLSFTVTDRFNDQNFEQTKRSRFAASANNAHWTQSEPSLANWLQNVPAFAYSGEAWVRDADIVAMAEVPRPGRDLCLSFSRQITNSAALLQAITNLKLQSAMDLMSGQFSPPNLSHSMRLVKAIESTVAAVTEKSFSFQINSHPKPRLEVGWGNGNFPFDLLPDGLRAIIGQLAHAIVMMDSWLQGKSDPQTTEAVFLFDELESHLHPAWQRRILPAFQRLFPKSQIFVATHSPFVIASLNHGWVHQLVVGKDGKVTNKEPRPASEGDSYVSVVEDIMGVHEWYDPETESLLTDFRAKRDAAYAGDENAKLAAKELADRIGKRSLELGYMMGRELSQMDRQLAKTSPAR